MRLYNNEAKAEDERRTVSDVSRGAWALKPY
jgi:hypothetical protein